MRNKYMLRGLMLIAAGVALNVLGWFTEQKELEVYKWAMGIGTVLFGFGFLTVLYSLIRKVERQSILEERAMEQEKLES